MKIEVDCPKLERIIEEAAKRGFTVAVPSIKLTQYGTTVSCDGVTTKAHIREKANGNVILETGSWKDHRLRICIGKRKVNVIGNRVKWTMSKFKKEPEF